MNNNKTIRKIPTHTSPHNRINELSRTKIDQYIRKYHNNLEKAAFNFASNQNCVELSHDLFELLKALKKSRKPIKKDTLRLYTTLGQTNIQKKICLLNKSPFSIEQNNIIDAAGKDPNRPQYPLLFNQNQDRIYLEIDNKRFHYIQNETQAYVTSKGFTITDYQNGIAYDHKRKINVPIARILDCVPRLFKNFISDPNRSLSKQLVVISKRPYDIARMSTNRSWSSCMDSKSDFFNSEIQHEIKAGLLIAYLISEHDPEIHDPLSRLLIRPYKNKQGEYILIPERQIGISNSAFKSSVIDFIETYFNHNKTGFFQNYKNNVPQGYCYLCRIQNSTSYANRRYCIYLKR